MAALRGADRARSGRRRDEAALGRRRDRDRGGRHDPRERLDAVLPIRSCQRWRTRTVTATLAPVEKNVLAGTTTR
jgi:hypothetical protein